MERSRGFSLVELMVAMVVSLVVILGAGQLFISLSQTSQRVSLLSEKQAAVNFAVETLLRDVRRAYRYGHDDVWDGEVLTLYLRNRDDFLSGCSQGDNIVKRYRLRDISDDNDSLGMLESKVESCDGSDTGDTYQELVGGFISPDDDGFDVDDGQWAEGVLQVTLRLVPTDDDATPDTLTFHAVNRTAVF